MLFVDYTGFQLNYSQFFTSAVWGAVMAIYCLTLPNCPVNKERAGTSLSSALGLDAFKLFKQGRMAMFFIFSMLLGAALQVSNGYANMFIGGFGAIEEYAGTFAVEHTNMLISLSQISETLCILLIPFFLKKFGIKVVMLIAMLGWVFRFGFFAIGDPGMPGVLLFVLSMIVYGVAFDFFNISGSLFVDQEVPENLRSSAQGLFMLMTNGLGASIGVIAAQEVVNHFTANQANFAGWSTAWYIFAAYALVIAVLFAVLFREKKTVK
jgi:nucleoside transporter